MDAPIVTLTTDWGDGDFFAGMVKGVLYQHLEGVRVVDITHKVRPYSIVEASFVVKHACVGFPAGTIHIIDVATVQPFLAIKAQGQYFLCCDNGLPTTIFGDNHMEEICVLPTKENGIYNFAALTVFAQTAINIAKGMPLPSLGKQPTHLIQSSIPNYYPKENGYGIYVNYFDTYGNAYLGMSYREFEEFRAGRPFVMIIRDQEVSEISLGYYNQQQSSDPRHKLQLTVSATGMLELAHRQGSLQQLLGLQLFEPVTLIFK